MDYFLKFNFILLLSENVKMENGTYYALACFL